MCAHSLFVFAGRRAMKAVAKHPVVERVEPEVERTLRDFGYELVQLKFGGPPGNQTLSVYLDKPGGVTTGDCQYMAERLSVLLDVLDPISSSYHLLISSPGVDRPLTRDIDFERFAGKHAAVTFRDAAGQRATVRGRLQGLAEGQVVLEVGGETQRVPAEAVEQAHLVFKWDDEDKAESDER
jgi:ribosome maturation factor RimP